MGQEHHSNREPLEALRFRAHIAAVEIDSALDRAEKFVPDATAAAVSAWAFEIAAAAQGFLAATSDIDGELGD